MKAKEEIFDISAQLEKEFGPIGSEGREKAIDLAWEEYNAQILLDARKSAKLTQQELADRIGADKGYISRIERGLTVPTVTVFYKLVAAMGLSVVLKPMST